MMLRRRFVIFSWPRRSNLRLLTELHAAGVFDGSRLIVRIVRSLCGLGPEGKEKEKDMK